MEDKILNNKLKTISTNTLIIGMGAIVSKGAAFIIAFVLANFLSTKQYGSLDVILHCLLLLWNYLKQCIERY